MPRPGSLSFLEPTSPGCQSIASIDSMASETAFLLRFIEEQRLLSQWHLEQQQVKLRKALEKRIDKAVAELRQSLSALEGAEVSTMGSMPTLEELRQNPLDPPASATVQLISQEPVVKNGQADSPVQQPPPARRGSVSSEESAASGAMTSERHGSNDDSVSQQSSFMDPVVSPAKRPSQASSASTVGKKTMRKSQLQRVKAEAEFHADTALQRFILGPLDVCLAFVILLSTLSIFIDMELYGIEANYALGLRQEEPLTKLGNFFGMLEYPFCIFFIVDLSLRLYAFGWAVVQDFVGVMDATVVVFTTVDTFVLKPLADSNFNYSFIRVIRYVKLVRTLRLMRTMPMFHQLRVLVRAISASLLSLFWSMVILFCFQLGFALMLVQLLHPWIMDEENDYKVRMWANQYYGSSFKAWWTMFEVTFAGSWPSFVRPLIEEIHWAYSIFMGAYMALVVFAVIRVITALFLKDTLEEAQKDAALAVTQMQTKKEEFTETLREIFHEADTSGDGQINWDEFCALLADDRTKMYLKTLDLDFGEAAALFKLLDDCGDGHVSFEEFNGGITRMKGQAQALDVYSILTIQKSLVKEVSELSGRMELMTQKTAAGPRRGPK